LPPLRWDDHPEGWTVYAKVAVVGPAPSEPSLGSRGMWMMSTSPPSAAIARDALDRAGTALAARSPAYPEHVLTSPPRCCRWRAFHPSAAWGAGRRRRSGQLVAPVPCNPERGGVGRWRARCANIARALEDCAPGDQAHGALRRLQLGHDWFSGGGGQHASCGSGDSWDEMFHSDLIVQQATAWRSHDGGTGLNRTS